jgi:hypothetical protein
MTLLTFFSLSGIAVSLFCEIFYLYLILTRKVLASVPAFLIFTLTTALAGASAISLGAWQDGVVPIVFAISHIILIAVVLYIKQRARFHWLDLLWIFMAGLSGFLWFWLDNAWIALFCAFAIDLFGYFALFHKMYREPGKENAAAWGLAGAAYGLPLLGGLLAGQAVQANSMFSWMNFILCMYVAALQLYQNKRLNVLRAKLANRPASFTEAQLELAKSLTPAHDFHGADTATPRYEPD